MNGLEAWIASQGLSIAITEFNRLMDDRSKADNLTGLLEEEELYDVRREVRRSDDSAFLAFQNLMKEARETIKGDTREKEELRAEAELLARDDIPTDKIEQFKAEGRNPTNRPRA